MKTHLAAYGMGLLLTLAVAGCERFDTGQAGQDGETRVIDPVAQAASRYSVTESNSGFEDTVSRLFDAIDRRDLTIFAVIDHAAAAREAGVPDDARPGPATVVIFGSPQIGTSLMKAKPLLATELPLRASVFEDTDGVVKVATTSVTALGRDYPELEAQTEKLATISGNLTALRAEAAGGGRP